MNKIHPTAIIEEGAVLGDDNYIGPYCYIASCVRMGSHNRLEAFVSIGTAPEHKSRHLHEENNGVIILDGCVFKEFVTINRGTTEPTFIGNGVWMLTKSHVGHDALVEHHATLSCGVFVGGHAVVMENANIGLGTMIHQFRVIGVYAMVGMNSTVTKDVWPFTKYYGSPAKIHGINEIGLMRSGVESDDLHLFHGYLFDITKGEKDMIVLNHRYDKHLNRYSARIAKVLNE